MLRAGESQGVTPGLAVLELGVWTTSSNVHSYLKARISEIAAGVASTWQVEAAIQHIGDAPLADHDESLGLVAQEVARMTPGIDNVVETLQLSAADDATVLLEHVSARGGRGIYSVIGSDLADGHHTPAFDFDEASLLHGTTVVSGIISSLLR
jgi:aminobenzoyl-glutamate utilization protein A